MKIINKKRHELKHFERNPRTITKEDMDHLKNSIRKFGMVDPLIIDENNVVIGGNQRLIAADDLKLDEIPCIVISDLSDTEKKTLNIALNKISGDWDITKLQAMLKSIKDIDETLLGFTGFSEDETAEMIDMLKEQEPDFEFNELNKEDFNTIFVRIGYLKGNLTKETFKKFELIYNQLLKSDKNMDDVFLTIIKKCQQN